ncbi:MAG: cytochrome c peroxidase [Bacteroidales bacterium]|nr:cytochrome c peroxidase [Bacteroidales bacterium]
MKPFIKISKVTKPLAVLPFFLMAVVLFFVHCASPETRVVDAEMTDLQQRALALISPIPENAFPDGIAASDELIDLGKMLFYEPRLSKSGLISCNTCHNMATFGVDQLPVSIGHMWQKGPRNAPTVLNAALHTTQFWDGREPDVESQALMPILDKLEMAATQEHVLAVLNSMPGYVERFHRAFPDQEQPLVYENVGVAIGAFERILLTPSRFDDYLRGDRNALTEAESQGLQTFLDTGCHSCHGGPALGGRTFSFFQTPAELASGTFDTGRYDVTGNELDKYVFKVPSLLNINKTYPYFHDGSEWSLAETVRVVARDMLQRELTHDEVAEIVVFLGALTGEIPAYALELPVLPPSTAETPRPVFN